MSALWFVSKKNEALVFKTMGFEVFIIDDERKINDFLKHVPTEVKVLAYDHEMHTYINVYKEHKKQIFPLLLEVPFDLNHQGIKQAELKEKIKKSIGIDLL